MGGPLPYKGVRQPGQKRQDSLTGSAQKKPMACWSSTLARQPENTARTTGSGPCQLEPQESAVVAWDPGMGDAPPALRSYWFTEQCARGRQGTGQQD